jgi:hypothetical protein
MVRWDLTSYYAKVLRGEGLGGGCGLEEGDCLWDCCCGL